MALELSQWRVIKGISTLNHPAPGIKSLQAFEFAGLRVHFPVVGEDIDEF
jgi:hypothetical protein